MRDRRQRDAAGTGGPSVTTDERAGCAVRSCANAAAPIAASTTDNTPNAPNHTQSSTSPTENRSLWTIETTSVATTNASIAGNTVTASIHVRLREYAQLVHAYAT